MKRLISGLAVLLLVVAMVAGCGSGAKTPGDGEKLKVAFVYIGPVGDGGYTYAHDLGRKYLEQELGDKIETTYIENVPEGADAERVFEDLAQDGYQVIFGTSFGYMQAMEAVAQRYPDTVFLHCSGYTTAENMGTYFGRNHESFYLAGIAAGLNTENNQIGMVAAVPIPEVIRAINALTLGARSVNPDAKVKVIWTNTWFDPAKEKDAANSLLEAGADFITMYQDSPGPLQAAQEAGKLATGNSSDSRQYAPKAFVTAPIWVWGPYYVKTVQAVMDGTWKSEQYWGHMSDGIVDVAPISDVAKPGTKEKVEEAKQKLMNGTFDPFTGPIKDQSGKLKVTEGQKLSDEELLNMMWFVEGVEGTIPDD